MQHAYNITIKDEAVIGSNVTMYKGSTVGMDRSGIPEIGDNVYIGLNSTIVGGGYILETMYYLRQTAFVILMCLIIL